MTLLQKVISEKFTQEVLGDILLKKAQFSNAIIKDITIGNGTTKGESYLSAVTRFSIEISGNNEGADDRNQLIYVIAKGLPANMATRETFRSTDFFKNEVAFYDKVWPALDAFQKSKKVKNPVNIVPECLALFCDGAHDFIALEDLTYRCYASMPRTTSLNFERAIEIIREFGRFHALSIAFKEQGPEEFSQAANALEETYFDLKFRHWYTAVITKILSVLRDAVEKELPKKYADKFDVLLKMDLFGAVCKLCKDHTNLSGITHGDCWAPNFLVKYDDTGKLKTKFIDYQLSRHSSVVMDLTFFLYVCVEPSTLYDRWDEFIRTYTETVSDFLEQLGSNEKLISVDKVNDALKKIGLFTFLIGAEGIVMSGVEDEDVVDIDEIQEVTTPDKVWILKPIENKVKRKKVAGFFKHLVDGEFI